jgi:PAS domain S-box-containing protein
MQDRPSVAASIDFRRLFDAVPHPLLVCDPDLRVVEANSAYCAILGRSREVLVGREAFSLFPDTPQLPAGDGVEAVRTSMQVARDTGQTQVMPLQRYDVADPGTGIVSERYWSIVTVPVLDGQGATVLLLNQVDDVTASVLQRPNDRDGRGEVENGIHRVEHAEADVYARAHDVESALAAEADASCRLPH